MIIALRGGHCAKSTGAIGLMREYETMQQYYKYVAQLLMENGHTVINCNTNGSSKQEDLEQGSVKSNKQYVDLFISLHMNASKEHTGRGVECWVYNENSRAIPYAKKICDNFAKLGFRNRGVKYNSSFYEMRRVVAPNIIFETCFCDNKEDVMLWNSLGMERLARALCNAIDSRIHLEVEVKKQYQVSINFNNKANAEEIFNKYKNLGYNCNMSEV